MTSTLIWLVSILDDVKNAATVGLGACPCVFLLAMFVCGMSCMELSPKQVMPYALKIAQAIGVVFVACLIGRCLLPSSKTAAAMYILPKVVKRECVEDTDREMLKQFHLQVNRWFWELEKK